MNLITPALFTGTTSFAFARVRPGRVGGMRQPALEFEARRAQISAVSLDVKLR
jgi:hypothetical protein